MLRIAIAAVALTLPPLPAAAPSLTLMPNPVVRGHVVQVAGSAGDCPTGDAVTILSHAFVHTHDFAGVPAVYARVRAGGAFHVSTRVPPPASPASTRSRRAAAAATSVC